MERNLALSYADSEFLYDNGGESAYTRVSILTSGTASTSGVARFSGFVCKRTEPVATIAFSTGAVAAAPTPTLIKYGLWERSPLRDFYTLVAQTAHDAALFAVINTRYPKAVLAPFIKQQGNEYLAGYLVVSAGAMPTLIQASTGSAGLIGTGLLQSPVRCASLAGQVDLPVIIPVSTLAISQQTNICDLLPT